MNSRLLEKSLFLLVTLGALGRLDAKPRPPVGDAVARGIIDELKLVPRPGKFNFEEAPWPIFAAKTLAPYQADYPSLDKLKARIREQPTQYPLRTAVLKAIALLDESSRWRVDLFVPAPIGPRQKADILAEQKKLGASLFHLERAFDELHKAGDDRRQEQSRRWQAHYDYVLAVLQARIVFGYEYMFLLGQFRREAIPVLSADQLGWRLGPRSGLQITEAKVQKLDREVESRWQKIERDHAGTPWEIVAQRERLSLRGLEWRPSRDAD